MPHPQMFAPAIEMMIVRAADFKRWIREQSEEVHSACHCLRSRPRRRCHHARPPLVRAPLVALSAAHNRVRCGVMRQVLMLIGDSSALGATCVQRQLVVGYSAKDDTSPTPGRSGKHTEEARERHRAVLRARLRLLHKLVEKHGSCTRPCRADAPLTWIELVSPARARPRAGLHM